MAPANKQAHKEDLSTGQAQGSGAYVHGSGITQGHGMTSIIEGRGETAGTRRVVPTASGIRGVVATQAKTLANAAGESGAIPASIDQGVGDNVIIHMLCDLYTSPESAVREILAREIRACHEARERYGAEPRIEVEIDAGRNGHTSRDDHGRITVRGVDSMGISEAKFLERLRSMGRSCDSYHEFPDQLGVNHVAYTALSFGEEFRSHSRETGEKFYSMQRDGVVASPVDMTDAGSAEAIGRFGTEVRILMSDRVDRAKVIDMVRRCGLFNGVPISIRVGDRRPECVKTCAFEDASDDLVADSNSEYAEPTRMSRRLSKSLIEGDDMDMLVTYASEPPGRRDAYHGMSFLNRMPIDFQYNGEYAGMFYSVVLNVKDEKEYVPRINRGSFHTFYEERLTSRIDRIIRDKMGSIAPSTLAEYAAGEETRMLDAARILGMRTPGYDGRFSDMMRCRGTFFEVSGGSTVEYVRRIGDLWDGRPVLITETLDDYARMAAVKAHHGGDVEIFKPHDASEASMGWLQGLGLETLDSHVERTGIRIGEEWHAGYRRVETYFADGSHADTVNAGDVGKDAVLAPDGGAMIIRAFGIARSCIEAAARQRIDGCHVGMTYFTRSADGAGVCYGDYLKGCEGRAYETGRGRMEAGRIAGGKNAVLVTFDDQIPQFLEDGGATVVKFGGGAYADAYTRLFELALVCTEAGAAIRVISDPCGAGRGA